MNSVCVCVCVCVCVGGGGEATFLITREGSGGMPPPPPPPPPPEIFLVLSCSETASGMCNLGQTFLIEQLNSCFIDHILTWCCG